MTRRVFNLKAGDIPIRKGYGYESKLSTLQKINATSEYKWITDDAALHLPELNYVRADQ